MYGPFHSNSLKAQSAARSISVSTFKWIKLNCLDFKKWLSNDALPFGKFVLKKISHACREWIPQSFLNGKTFV